MGRTLYLNENDNDLMLRRDGPSLWVKAKEKAGQRIPVRVISRVVIIGNVKLDSDAITLFAENDVPVVFMNHRADEVAVAMPYNHRLPKHYDKQKVFLENDNNTARYENWASTRRMLIQANVVKRLYPEIAHMVRRGIGEGNYQELIRQKKPSNEEQWSVAAGIVNNLFRGLIIEHVLKADIDPHLGVLHRRHNFGFVLDICYILGAESDMQCIQFFRPVCPAGRSDNKGREAGSTCSFMEKRQNRYRVTGAGFRDIIHRFENRRAALHNMVENTIDELFELIRELRS